MKYIAYRRVSTKEQGDSRNGLEAQALAIREFALREGDEIIAEFEEVISGKFYFDDRPVMKRAMELAAKTGAHILVSKLDRLSRSVQHISTLMNNRKVNFTVASLGKTVGNLELHIHAVIAENERKMIGERTCAALNAKVVRGELLGFATHANPAASKAKASVAAGAAVKAEADEFAKRIAPVILRMRKVGMTVNAIAAELNEQGNRTARGGKWYASTVCNILARLEG